MLVNKFHVTKLKSDMLTKSINKACVSIYFLIKSLDVEFKTIFMVV